MYHLQYVFSPTTSSKLLCNHLILGTRFGKGNLIHSPSMANGKDSSAALSVSGLGDVQNYVPVW